MYPPAALVRFSKRFLIRSIRPGRERPFRWLAVSGFVSIPAIFVCLVAMYALWDVSPAQVWLVWLVAASLVGSLSMSCDQWAVLTEGGRPLLSAWLRVASLGAWMLGILAYCVVARLLLGWIAAALLALLMIALVAVEIYRGRSRASD